MAGELPSPELVYQPALAGQARVAYLERKYNISREEVFTVRIEEMKRKGLVRWENFETGPVDLDGLSTQPKAGARFATLDELAIEDGKYVSDLKSDFEDWIYRTKAMTIRINEALGVVAGPDVSEDQLKKMCAEAADAKRNQRDRGGQDQIRTEIGRPGTGPAG